MRHFLFIAALVAAFIVPGIITTARADGSDSFAGAPTIALNSSHAFNTAGSTSEPGDPWRVAYGSVWFRYVTPSRGVVRLNMTSTATTYFHVYHGTSLGKLSLVEQGISDGTGILTFPAEAGMELRIVVSTAEPDPADVGFTVKQGAWPYGTGTLVTPDLPLWNGPVNDLAGEGYATIIPSSASPVMVLAYNADATHNIDPFSSREPEPLTTGYGTVWYRWTAPMDGIAVLSTPAWPLPSFRHVLSVFRGNSLNLVKGGTDSIDPEGGPVPVSHRFAVVKGLEYIICFASRSEAAGRGGPAVFTLRTDAWPYGPGKVVGPPLPTTSTPPNDKFENATELPSKAGRRFSMVDYPGSMKWDDRDGVWYKWTAPESSYVYFQTASNPVAGYYHTLSAWTGDSEDNLKRVASGGTGVVYRGPPDTPGFAKLGFFAKKGKTYHLSLSIIGYRPGPAVITYESGPQVNTTAPRATFGRFGLGGQVNKSRFHVIFYSGGDPEGIGMVQLRVNGKLVYDESYESSVSVVACGPVKEGKVILRARASDRFGRWGPWTQRVVTAK